jgi:hypothetical protein
MRSRRSFLQFGIAAAATLAAAPASAATAAYHGTPRGGGTVSAIDDGARTFTAARRNRPWTYHTTDKTRFLVGGSPGAWSDLKVGSRVQVRWHRAGGQRVADIVSIRPPRQK